jgi:FkbM family methyltransferase
MRYSAYAIDGKYLNYGGPKLPDIRDDQDLANTLSITEKEVFQLHLQGDDYSLRAINDLRTAPYFFHDRGMDVRVKPGMVCIDAGAWIGDTAAMMAWYGGIVHAFEPALSNYTILQQTARLNPNIIPRNLGLGLKTEEAFLDHNAGNNSGAYAVGAEGEQITIVSLDEYAAMHDLHIHFIKADIEGFERNLLIGGCETIARDRPLLSICTYHLPDDPEVLPAIIQDICPAYAIFKIPGHLYAQAF